MTEKTIAFVSYPGFTLLDMVGPLQVFGGLTGIKPEYRVTVVGESTDPIPTDAALSVVAEHTFAEVPDPFAIVVPGGGAPTMRAMTNAAVLDYVRSTAAGAELVASVCTGSLILGAAGLLEGRSATTHWALSAALTAFGAQPVAKRWVRDGKVITAAGVSAGIDLALELVRRLEGEQVARDVQFGIEYDPEPPLGPLDWTLAPRQRWEAVAGEMVRSGLEADPLLRDRVLACL